MRRLIRLIIALRHQFLGEIMADTGERLLQAIQFKVDGDYESATPILLEILATEPDSFEAHRQLGLIYGFQGLFDESIEELQKALSLNRENVATLCDLAMTHAMLGMYEEAKAEFERVLQLDPENESALTQMVYFKDVAGV